MPEAHPHRVVADLQGGGQFLQCGVGKFSNVGLKFGRVELAPGAPGCFGGQRVGFDGGQIAIDRAPTHAKPLARSGSGTAGVHEFHHPFPQIQRIGLHALTVPASVLM